MLQEVIDVADKLGLIQAIKTKLVKQPDPAADKLVVVLEEILKIYEAIEAELTKYLGLFFDTDPQSLAKEHQILVELEGGMINTRIGKARGSCAKISNIFMRYLNPWFQKILNSTENQNMIELFRLLDEYDGVMINAMDELADWLGKKSTETLNLVEKKDLDGANALVRSVRAEIQPIRQKISKTMYSLYELEAEFIKVSKAVGNT